MNGRIGIGHDAFMKDIALTVWNGNKLMADQQFTADQIKTVLDFAWQCHVMGSVIELNNESKIEDKNRRN